MEFGILGPVQASGQAGVVDIGGARQQRLLAALILHMDSVAPTDRLIEIVFESEPPAGASTTIRSYIARLRKALGDASPGVEEVISTERGGYSLRIGVDATDAARFEASIETARIRASERDPIGAAAVLREGLALWRGDAYGDFAFEEWVRPEASRLEELKTVALEELNDALLACGLAHDVVSATRGQVAEHPLRERLRGQHMLALYRAGRQVEALRSLAEYQAELVEVGLEPSDDLLLMGRSIASQDPALRLDSPVGQPLRGYRVGAALGEGAHGVVYRAVQPGVGREVAIKTIRAQLADDAAFIRRFDAEAQLVANLEHPHIVPIYDYWREPGGAYIVMRLLADNLGARLAAGPMDVPAVATIARQLGSALTAAHRAGVVHGDIKPSNVLIDESSAYLADFGVATLVESTVGDTEQYPSSGYESPELLTGEAPTPASDQFALAVLIAHLLTGQLPFGTHAIATPHDRFPSIHVQRPSVPVRADEVMSKAVAWDVADRYPDVATFVGHLEAALSGDAVPTDRDHEMPNPYRGLRAFTETDHTVFFGRDPLADELVERLAGPGVDGRFVVVIGASGSGKSSVVRAGLLPRLRAGAVDGSEGWVIATMTPGSDPFGELGAALRSVATSVSGERTDEPDEHEVERILDAAGLATKPVLLVVDQLEELFTQVDDASTRRHFVNGLTRALRRVDGNLRVVATLRADFLDRPLRYSDFGQLVKDGGVTVVGMAAHELTAAVTQPAALAGVEVEPALTTQLVADVVDQPAGLPLLQFTLTELFDRRPGGTLTLQNYRELGGVDAAVAGRAEAVFAELDEDERRLARRAFLRLVTVDESGSVSRRRALRSDLGAATQDSKTIADVVDAFAASRLLTFDHDPHSREPTVEIAHEALITQWPRFGDWVADAGDGLRIHGQIAEATRTWERQGRDESDLYRGLRLQSALDWMSDQPDVISPTEREFVATSQEVRVAEEAAERAQAERDRRSNRRLRWILAGVGLLLIVAVVAAAQAVRQTDVAEAAVEEADLATLISRSAAQRLENPEVSILLALEAHRRSPAPETEQAVLNALGSSRIPNRVATFTGLDVSACPTPAFLSSDGLTEFAFVGGRLMSLDTTNLAVEDHGPSPDQCGVWLGDSASGRVVVGASSGERNWVGTFDDPDAIELEQSGPMFVFNGSIEGGVVAFIVEEPQLMVQLFDIETGEAIGEPIVSEGLWTVDIDSTGSFAAVSYQDFDATSGVGRLDVVDATTGQSLFQLDTPSPAASLAFDPATLELVAGMVDGSVMTVDLVTGEIVSSVTTTATSTIAELGIRSDGLITAMSGGQIEFVDRRTGSVDVVAEFRDAVGARVRPNGTIITFGTDGVYDVIELEGNALVERSWPIDPFVRVAFNDGKAGLRDQSNRAIEIVDLATGERAEMELRTSDGSLFPTEGVYPEPDGVWTIADEGIIARWEGETMVERLDFPDRLLTWTRFDDTLAVLGLDVDGNVVASLVNLLHDEAGVLFTVAAPAGYSVHPSLDGGLHVFDRDGTVRTYDSSGEPAGEIATTAENPLVNTMEPSTGVLATASGSGGVIVIDPAAGEVQHAFGNDFVANLGFARNGQLLVVTSFDGTVTVWDLDRGEAAGLVWNGAGGQLSSPSWYDEASDSIWVFTSGRLLEIPLDPERWVERACDIVGRDLTSDEWERFVPGDETVQSACT